MTYDVLEDAKTVALEADFMGRWQEQRGQLWSDITTMLPATEAITFRVRQPATNTRYLLTYALYGEIAPPPKVLTWWRRMAIRLLGGQP